jgi:hypothetical protein
VSLLLLALAAGWVVLATGVAVAVGKAIHTADKRTCGPCDVDDYEPLDVRL